MYAWMTTDALFLHMLGSLLIEKKKRRKDPYIFHSVYRQKWFVIKPAKFFSIEPYAKYSLEICIKVRRKHMVAFI